MLGGMKDAAGRADRSALSSCCRSRGRYVFEFKGNNRDIPSKPADSVQVLVRRRNLYVGHLPGWCVFVGRKRVNPISHAACRDGKHASELPAAKYPDSTARE